MGEKKRGWPTGWLLSWTSVGAAATSLVLLVVAWFLRVPDRSSGIDLSALEDAFKLPVVWAGVVLAVCLSGMFRLRSGRRTLIVTGIAIVGQIVVFARFFSSRTADRLLIDVPRAFDLTPFVFGGYVLESMALCLMVAAMLATGRYGLTDRPWSVARTLAALGLGTLLVVSGVYAAAPRNGPHDVAESRAASPPVSDGLANAEFGVVNPGPSESVLAAGRGYVVYGADRVTMYDGPTGGVLWSVDEGEVGCRGEIVAANLNSEATLLVTCAGEGVMYALDASTGEHLWSRERIRFGTERGVGPVMPVLAGADNRLSGLDVRTGRLLWQAPPGVDDCVDADPNVAVAGDSIVVARACVDMKYLEALSVGTMKAVRSEEVVVMDARTGVVTARIPTTVVRDEWMQSATGWSYQRALEIVAVGSSGVWLRTRGPKGGMQLVDLRSGTASGIEHGEIQSGSPELIPPVGVVGFQRAGERWTLFDLDRMRTVVPRESDGPDGRGAGFDESGTTADSVWMTRGDSYLTAVGGTPPGSDHWRWAVAEVRGDGTFEIRDIDGCIETSELERVRASVVSVAGAVIGVCYRSSR